LSEFHFQIDPDNLSYSTDANNQMGEPMVWVWFLPVYPT